MYERYKLMRKQMTKNLNNIITNVVANEMIENQGTAIEAVYAETFIKHGNRNSCLCSNQCSS